jgi:molybdate transport system substrate-binding protein
MRRVTAALIGLLGCGLVSGAGGHKAEARIYAAASLTDVIGVLAKRFEPIRGSHVVASFGASNTLAQQLREGAAPGVFVSASVEWVDKLEGWGLVEPGTRVDLAAGSLVVVVPQGATDRPATLRALDDPRYDRIALADPTAVPAGKYAKAALEKAGVFAALKGRIVAAQDVRTALAYVERGEAPVAGAAQVLRPAVSPPSLPRPNQAALRRHDDPVAVIRLGQRLGHEPLVVADLVLTEAVDVRRVDEGDTQLDGPPDDGLRRAPLRPGARRQGHGAESDAGDPATRAAEWRGRNRAGRGHGHVRPGR